MVRPVTEVDEAVGVATTEATGPDVWVQLYEAIALPDDAVATPVRVTVLVGKVILWSAPADTVATAALLIDEIPKRPRTKPRTIDETKIFFFIKIKLTLLILINTTDI